MADAVCELVRASLSARADGEATDVDDAHLASCAACARFERGVRSLRAALRFDVLVDAPDVAPAVLARITPRSRRLTWAPIAAAFVAGALLGSAFVWPSGGDDGIAAASLPAQIVAAQGDVASVAADLVVTEGDVTRRGTLRYRAPEALVLELGAESIVVADGATAGAIGLEPFAEDAVSPLDLALPASAFLTAGAPEVIGEREGAIGVRVTAAQIGALLDGLAAVGVGAAVHPTDPVDLWLDRTHLVPVEVVVRAAGGPDRARWAAARGLDTAVDEVALSIRYDALIVNDALSVDGMPVPSTLGAVDHGFVPGELAEPVLGMRPWRSGTVGDVRVDSWTDGRAWVKVRRTEMWHGGRLFGGLGAVRAVRLGGGIAYVADGGRAIGIHADGVDVVVTGSVAPSTLRRVAVSLGVRGLRVPDSWDEATVVDLDTATATAAVRTLPRDRGFEVPAVRVDGTTVTLTFAGGGDRVVVLSTRVDDALRPPIDPDAVGVLVRGRTARWSPASGDLEWVEDGQVWSLRSTTVALGELVALADALVTP